MKGLTLNQKDQARLQLLNRMLEGAMKVSEAASLMGLSERHTWRLLAAYRKEGAAALSHGNRGRVPNHTIPGQVKARVLELARGTYAGFNHTHLSEILAEREGLDLSRPTVRRILVSAGIKSPRHRRRPKHRIRRERYSQEGMLLQIDGSRHDWLEGRGPYLTVIGAIDDATGTVPFALFREQEDAHGYLLLLERTIKVKGVPLALYSDRHGIFERSPAEPESLDEQLQGKRNPTQFGRALRELGIESILAQSPQAKGRIERLWGTFQDRLVSLLRLAGASNADEANQVLWEFLPGFNERFGVPPQQPGSAYRTLPEGLQLESMLCFKYQRTVANDNTIHFAGQVLQLLPDMQRISYARARVQVQERLDGSIVVSCQGKTIAVRQAPAHPVTLRARNGHRGDIAPQTAQAIDQLDSHSGATEPASRNGSRPRRPSTKTTRPNKPAPNHPWRKPLLTKSQNS